jgi:hypothetical protein
MPGGCFDKFKVMVAPIIVSVPFWGDLPCRTEFLNDIIRFFIKYSLISIDSDARRVLDKCVL